MNGETVIALLSMKALKLSWACVAMCDMGPPMLQLWSGVTFNTAEFEETCMILIDQVSE